MRIAVLRDIHQVSIPQHRHDFLEIVIVLSGTAVHVTEAYRHRIEAGDVLVIGSDRRHGYDDSEDLCITNILVDFDIMHRLLRRLKGMAGFHTLFTLKCPRRSRASYPSHLRLEGVQLVEMKVLVDRLEEETQRNEGGASMIAEAYLTLIAGLLSRCYGKNGPVGAPKPASRLRPLLAWIEGELKRSLAIDDLARKAGMSRRVLQRRFGVELGVTPSEYLLNARIRKASQMLRDPTIDVRILEVAESCGFEDSNYFSRCFRKIMGRTPREYRAGMLP
jgi:AraC-like DNA-binding protein